MTNEAKETNGTRCMVHECGQAIALVKVSGNNARYQCMSCEAVQYSIEGNDGITRWMLATDNSFNSWVHGKVPS